jgi:two-component system CheB/CheR fusion protein
MDNLLSNTHIGTMFLDPGLNIRKANDVAAQLTNIRHSDIGRPIHHFSFDNLYKGFLSDIYQVIEDLKPREKEIRDTKNEWYLLRIIPYRTAENAVEGIIVTFVNITGLKQSLKQIDELSNQMELAMEIDEISW